MIVLMSNTNFFESGHYFTFATHSENRHFFSMR